MKFATIEEMDAYRDEHGLTLTEEFDADIEWESAPIINPGNSQKIVHALVPADEVEYEAAKIALTITTPYHDWHNTIADKIYNQANDYIDDPEEYELEEEDVAEYNKQVDAYNMYGDAEKINVLLVADVTKKILEKNSQ